MQPIRKEDLKQEVFDLYDRYAHNKLDRREFVEQISYFAVGGLTVTAILDYLMPKYATVQVPEDDPRLKSKYIKYQSPEGAGKMRGLLSRPKAAKGKLPGILVVHENRGLNPHIEDVCRRAALEGFLALAPDALTPLGGYPGNDDDGRTLQRQRDGAEMLEDFIAGFNYLMNHKRCNGKIGVVGFCFGGSVSNNLAVRVPELMAAVPFYGGQPETEEVPRIQAPLLLHFAELDERVNQGWPAYEAALREQSKEYTAYVYPGVNHGFHNDTTPRYDREAATLAWQRTIDFFKEKLR